MTDLLGLFEAHGLSPKKKTSGEWASPCPACGGRDRCMIRPEDHDGRGGYWCRQCGTYGDAIQFLRDYEGLGYHEACQRLGVAASRAAAALPRPPRRPGGEPFEAAPFIAPAEAWAAKASAFAAWAHRRLLENPAQLAWLAARGLPIEAAARFGLGWNPGDKGKPYLIRPRAAWGLPPAVAKPDAAGNPGRPKTTFWLPRGLVIPHLDPATPGRALRLRIRRPEADRADFKSETKYYVIPGSSMDAMILGREARAFVVVESELDALMLFHQLGDLVGAVSVMTANVRKIEAGVLEALREALCILVALDAEGRDGAGAKGFARWAETFPRAKRWPVPVGKDPGEAHAAGANLRAWVLAGLPPVLRPGLFPPGRTASGRGEASRDVEVRAARGIEGSLASGGEVPTALDAWAPVAPVAEAQAAQGDEAPVSPVAEAQASPAARVPVWLHREAASVLGRVPLGELFELMRPGRVEPVLVSGLAGPGERVLALWSDAEIPAESWSRIGGLFFGSCLDAVLYFADLRRISEASDLSRVRGLADDAGEWGVVVRRLGREHVGLEGVGWSSLAYWRAEKGVVEGCQPERQLRSAAG